MVKTVPHFGHFTLASSGPAHPSRNAATRLNARNKRIHLFMTVASFLCPELL
jgi:hypothetical protein